MITASIIGGTGYTGGELLRLLANHPYVDVEYVTSRKEAGKKITKIHPHLRGIKKLENLEFMDVDVDKIDSDVVFCATPHGASMKIVPQLIEKGLKVIDLSGDYRFENIGVYEEWYGLKHTGVLEGIKIAYGLPELHRDEIIDAQLVANPGCFPTGAILAVAPLVKENIIEERIIIDSKTGVSGAGVNPTETTHFPNVNEDITPYKITTHRHTPEIEKELKKIGNARVSFTPHLAPITRGILTTAHTFVKKEINKEELIKLYKKFYKDEPFVRIFEDGKVSLTGVRGTNFCDIGGFEIDRNGRLVMTSSIDNLVKGASGQAIQNMNIMFGFEETLGLLFGGLKP